MFDTRDRIRRQKVVCGGVVFGGHFVGRMPHHSVGGIEIDFQALAGIGERIAQLMESRRF